MHADHLRVLVVDDMKLVRQTVRSLLEQSPAVGFIAEAADGVSGVESALQMRPDVVVMDVQMPRLNGVEATRQIKAVLPQTAIIGFSVLIDGTTSSLMADAGACAMIPKEQAYDLPTVIERIAALR